ncbi:MAG: FAD-binding oxidoreductase [Candidatus Rokubacteria bacterium]|nr:FAD-binding oxidoreductase [Candidatus Rokubacteria bacterium]
MDRADVVVIGGGVMGTSIAFHLARRRVGRVILLEKNTVCSGTSAKSSAIVRTHYTTPTTAAMALMARRIFEHWADEVGGESGFVKTGMLVIGPADARDTVERTLTMNRSLGIEASLIGAREVRRLGPQLHVPDDAAVVWEPHSGYANPHDVASSFAQRFVELGGSLRQSTPAIGIDVSGGRVHSVTTSRDTIATAHVVIAAGPWARPVGRLAALDLPVTPSHETILTLRPAFAWSPRHPVTVDLVNEVYLRPETGGLLLVGNTRDDIIPGDPDHYEDRPDPAYTMDALTRLARLIPAAAETPIVGGWCGMYEVSPDWNPIMGTAAEVAGLHYAVGFSGHGFKLSPVVGLLMAEQVAEGRARTIDITPYRRERFAEGKELRVAYARAGVMG